jgi:hypothetical protein
MEGSHKVWMADSHQIMMIPNTKCPTERRVGCNSKSKHIEEDQRSQQGSTESKMRQPEVHTRSGRASRLAARWIEAMITQILGTTGNRVEGNYYAIRQCSQMQKPKEMSYMCSRPPQIWTQCTYTKP